MVTGKHINIYGNIRINDIQEFLTGTVNQVTVTDTGNSATLSTPQDIHTGASPTFAGATFTGDVVFQGTGGLVYGSFYGNEIGWSQAAAQNTWYNIVDADMADGMLNGVTHDGNGKLTVTEPGMYHITYQLSAESSAVNKHIQTGIEISGSGSAEAQGINHFEISNIAALANTQVGMSGGGIFDLADNATIEVSVRTTDTGTPTIAVDHLMIQVVQIGGT